MSKLKGMKVEPQMDEARVLLTNLRVQLTINEKIKEAQCRDPSSMKT